LEKKGFKAMTSHDMTPRERLTAALRRQPVDRLPWTVDLGYYNAAMREQKRFDPRYEGVEGYLRQHEELGADPYFGFAPEPCRFELGGVKREVVESGREITTTYEIGGRRLVGIRRFMQESFCWAVAKHPVETTDDLETFLRMAREFRVVPDVESHRRMQEQCGQRALLICALAHGPIASLMTQWCGVMALAYLSADAQELFEETLTVLEGMAAPLITALAEYRPVVVHFCDNISGENVGSYWDRYMAPVYRRWLKPLQQAGIICVIHNDGTVRSVLPKIAAVGFDGAEAITPAPVGDVEPGDLRRLCGREDFILWGGIPGAIFPRIWTEEHFRAYVERVLAEVSGPRILGSADQIPPDGDVTRVRLVADILARRSR
jgi:uroporphyrinogen-III decarboxylase